MSMMHCLLCRLQWHQFDAELLYNNVSVAVMTWVTLLGQH